MINQIVQAILSIISRLIKPVSTPIEAQPKLPPTPVPPPTPTTEKPKPQDDEPRWMVTAKNELGVKETQPPNKRIADYHALTNVAGADQRTAWCSSFVVWCLENSGYRSTRSAWARSFLDYGIKVEKPAYGDIVILSRNVTQGHVGFVIDIDAINVTILGGNQSNEVNIEKRPRLTVLGYRRPVKKVNP